MIITVFGATGQVGSRIVQTALALGHEVRAFGRNVNDLIDRDLASAQFTAIKGYVFDEADVLEAVTGAHVILSALGGSFDGKDQTRSLGIKNIIQQMEATGVRRIVALGGMGILDAPDGGLLINQPDYPEEYKPVGMEHLKAYQYLAASSLAWSFVCAPDIINQDATQQYITAANMPPTPNLFRIHAGDLAQCMIDIGIHHQYLHQRVGISQL
jgi:putative NADH-flavin reductase